MNTSTKIIIALVLLFLLVVLPALFVLAVFIGAVYWLYKRNEERCPFCKADKSKIMLLKTKIISEKPRYETVTRHDIIRMPSKNSKTGFEEEAEGTIERQEQVRVIDTIERHYYKCGACKKSWTKDFVSTEEG